MDINNTIFIRLASYDLHKATRHTIDRVVHTTLNELFITDYIYGFRYDVSCNETDHYVETYGHNCNGYITVQYEHKKTINYTSVNFHLKDLTKENAAICEVHCS